MGRRSGNLQVAMALRSSAGARFGRAALAMATWRSPLRSRWPRRASWTYIRRY